MMMMMMKMKSASVCRVVETVTRMRCPCVEHCTANPLLHTDRRSDKNTWLLVYSRWHSILELSCRTRKPLKCRVSLQLSRVYFYSSRAMFPM